jgi:hypothetical protein
MAKKAKSMKPRVLTQEQLEKEAYGDAANKIPKLKPEKIEKGKKKGGKK